MVFIPLIVEVLASFHLVFLPVGETKYMGEEIRPLKEMTISDDTVIKIRPIPVRGGQAQMTAIGEGISKLELVGDRGKRTYFVIVPEPIKRDR
jgi:hypothetical protein